MFTFYSFSFNLSQSPVPSSHAFQFNSIKISIFFLLCFVIPPETLQQLHRHNRTPYYLMDLKNESAVADSDNDTTLNTSSDNSTSNNSVKTTKCAIIHTMPIIEIVPPPSDTDRPSTPQRPVSLVIPELCIQTPSPTNEEQWTTISHHLLGSPPPQRASIGETSELFPNKKQQKRLLMHFDKPGSLDFPFVPPMITITSNYLNEIESDADLLSPAPSKLMPTTTASGMNYLSPFSIRGDRAPSEGNLSSSGYSSASAGPSRCGSNTKLSVCEIDDGAHHSIGRLPSILKRAQKQQKKDEQDDDKDTIDAFRKRSDSETFSDDTILESNDEGIGTDHLDERIEDGDIRSAKELEVYIGKELIENGKTLMSSGSEEQSIITTMSQLQLPSIVVQFESGSEKLSPVSSRSESPLSERNNGMWKFSPEFCGKRDQQLPFTDSDGLYDFPSSDSKSVQYGMTHQKRNSSKKRERRMSKTSNKGLRVLK